jgi:O-antigen/teichoic acid export membrane protein
LRLVPDSTLALLGAQAAAGYYAAALRFLTAARTLPGAVLNTLLPVFANNTPRARKRLRTALGASLLLGSAGSAALALAAEPLVLLVYGSAFGAAADVLRVLAWLFVLHLLNVVLEAYLLANQQERLVNAALLAAILVAAGLTALLTAQNMSLGVAAAWGAVAGHATSVLCCAGALRRVYTLKPAPSAT